jgi:choline-glycine betaine transporter
MKTLLKLPISTIKVILALAALPFGCVVMLCVIIFYQDYTSQFARIRHKTAES